MKILLSFCTILLVMSNILFSQTHISGALEGTLPSGTYIVDDVIYVLQSDSLIIDPGVTLLFNGNFEFNVNGYLYAVGTHYDSIKFIHNIPDSTWGGIDFNDFTHDSSKIEYCLIMGSNSSGVYCYNSNPTISHCTIKNNSSTDNGGGITCLFNSNPIINNCIISNNEVGWGDAGGIYLDDSNAYIINCTITNNVGYHGGIHCQDSRSPMIKNSIIANNDGNQGGGISIYNYTEAIITNCKIINNTADWGAGFYFSHAAPSIIGCSIVGNAAERNGGGIQSDYDSEPKIINSTILNNTAVEYGGGISGRGFTHSGQFDIINTMVNYNTNGGIYFGYDRYNKNSVINSNIYDNKTYDYDGYVPENFGVISSTNNNGTLCDAFQNIFDDPMLSDTLTGDFSLQANSPCIDAGLPDTTGLELPQFDLNGNDRITDGNSDGNLYIDIGALEFSETIINNPPKIEKITNFEFINTENYNINLDTCVTDEEDLPENIHWNIVSHDNNLRITTANHLVIFTAPNWAGKTNVTFIASDNSGGSDTITVECTVNPPTSIDLDLNSNPKEFFLYQNYPNPFNPITSINYQLAKTSNVNLSIYNILGKKVVTLVTAKQQVGLYKIEWDASNFASGVYYYILKTDKGFTQSRKLILLR